MRVSFGRLNAASIGLLYRQLAIMIASDVPVPEAMQVLSEESENRRIRKITGSISDDLKKGMPLVDSLKKYPSIFNDFILVLFQRKNENKKVSEALLHIADATEGAGIIRSKLFRALFFPMVTLAFGLFLLIVIAVFVIPIFKDMFEGLGAALPLPTLFLLNISGWVIQNFIYLFIACIILVILVVQKKRPAYLLGALIPGFSRLLKRTSMILFTKHLCVMLSFGIPAKEAIQKAASTVKNSVHARKLAAAADAVSNTEQLVEALMSTGLFSKIVLKMIHYGSKSNTLSLVLDEVSNFYEKEFDRSVSRFLGLTEIIAIFAVGFIVGFIVISMYLPIFKMAGAIA